MCLLCILWCKVMSQRWSILVCIRSGLLVGAGVSGHVGEVSAHAGWQIFCDWVIECYGNMHWICVFRLAQLSCLWLRVLHCLGMMILRSWYIGSWECVVRPTAIRSLKSEPFLICELANTILGGFSPDGACLLDLLLLCVGLTLWG